MSKVIHLSDEAHHEAKEYCKVHGLRMSDWVAELIKAALAHGDPALPAVSLTPAVSAGLTPQCTPANVCKVATSPVSISVSGTTDVKADHVSSAPEQPISPIIWPREERNSRVADVPPVRSTMAAFVPKKKMLASYDETPETNAEGVPPYAAPPFWAKAK